MNKTIVHTISEYFANQPVEKAWIFGSYARSEENKDSDIDILVNFLPGSKITLFQYVHMLNELQSLTGRRIDLVEDGQLKPFAVKSAGQDKVLIYERKNKG
jgi:predicted nucleotidyltransferase